MRHVQRLREEEENTWVSLGKLHENAARVLFLGLQDTKDSQYHAIVLRVSAKKLERQHT